MRRIRAAAAQYSLADKPDFVPVASAASSTIPLAEACDPEYSIPMPGGSGWEIEGAESSAEIATQGREIRDYGMIAGISADGLNFTVSKAADTSVANTDWVPVNVLTCKDAPNAPTAWRVRRVIRFDFAAVAGNRVGGTPTVLYDSGNAIVNPSQVVPVSLGFTVGGGTTRQQSQTHSAIQDPVSGQITGANMGGDHTQLSACAFAEVEFFSPVGRIQLTGAQLLALAQAQDQPFVPNEDITAAMLSGGPVYRSFFDPLDTSTGSGSGTGQYNQRFRYMWRIKEPYTFPANETDISVADRTKFERIGPGASYADGTVVPQQPMSAHVELITEIAAATGTAAVLANKIAPLIFTDYTVFGDDSSDRRPVRWRKPTGKPSSFDGMANIFGNASFNVASTYDADAIFNLYVVDIEGLDGETISFFKGPRAVEFDPDTEFDNSDGVLPINTELEVDGTDQYMVRAQVTNGSSDAGGGGTNAGKSAARFTRTILGMNNADIVEVHQFGNNFQRSLRVQLDVLDFSNVKLTDLAEFEATVTGDFIDGVSVALASSGSTQFANNIDHIRVAGTAQQIPISAGASPTAGSADSVDIDSFFGGDWRFVLPGTETLVEAVSTTGEVSEPFAITVPLGAGMAGITTLDSAEIAARNVRSMLSPFTHPVGQIWVADTQNLSRDGVRYGLSGSETVNTAAIFTAATGLSAGQECTFDPLNDGLTGDAVEQLQDVPAGPFVLPAPFNTLSGDLVSDGSCIRTTNTTLGRAVYTTPNLTDNVIWTEVLYDAVSPNDDISGALALPSGEMFTYSVANSASNSLGPVDVFDLQYVDAAGAFTGLDTVTTSQSYTGTVRVRIEYSFINSILTLYVDQLAILSIQTTLLAPTNGGLMWRGLNVNGTCLAEFAVKGETALQLQRLQGGLSVPTIMEGDTITADWSQANNAASYTATDHKGNTTAAQAATAVDGDTDQIAAIALAPSQRFGRSLLTAVSGESLPFDYAPTTGAFVDLDPVGPLHKTGQTAAWSLDSQLAYPDLTDQGNAVIGIDSFGVITVASVSEVWQSLDVAEFVGGSYQPAVKQYVFPEIREVTPAAGITVNPTVQQDVNLAAIFNDTITLPLAAVGSTGNPLQVSASGILGLSIVDLHTTAPKLRINTTSADGTYNVTITATDPDGCVATSTLSVTVSTPVVVVSPTLVNVDVQAVNVDSIGVLARGTSNSGSGQTTTTIIAVPLGTPQATEAQILAGTDHIGLVVPSAMTLGGSGTDYGITVGGLTTGITYEIQYAICGSTGLCVVGRLDNAGAGYTPTEAIVGDISRTKRDGLRTRMERKPSNLKPNLNKGQ